MQDVHRAKEAGVVVLQQVHQEGEQLELKVGDARLCDVDRQHALEHRRSAWRAAVYLAQVAPHDVHARNNVRLEVAQSVWRALHLLQAHVQTRAPHPVAEARVDPKEGDAVGRAANVLRMEQVRSEVVNVGLEPPLQRLVQHVSRIFCIEARAPQEPKDESDVVDKAARQPELFLGIVFHRGEPPRRFFQH